MQQKTTIHLTNGEAVVVSLRPRVKGDLMSWLEKEDGPVYTLIGEERTYVIPRASIVYITVED